MPRTVDPSTSFSLQLATVRSNLKFKGAGWGASFPAHRRREAQEQSNHSQGLDVVNYDGVRNRPHKPPQGARHRDPHHPQSRLSRAVAQVLSALPPHCHPVSPLFSLYQSRAVKIIVRRFPRLERSRRALPS